MNTKAFKKLFFFISASVLLGLYSDILAERYVTVATIGNAPSVLKSENKQEIVDHVIAFWGNELKQVLPDKPDLIVLPEYCDLSDEGEAYLMVRKNQILDYFSSVAKKNNCYISFGMKREEKKGLWRNSCVVIDRNGGVAGIYNKNFPTIEEMKSGIKACYEAPVINCDFGKVAIAICYDLNFDELRLQYVREKPDLIIFSSMYHGGVAQSIWAYTCRAYFIGSVYRQNPSEIRNPMGQVVATSTNYFDFAVARINLDCELVHLDYNWEKLAALKEKYGTSVTVIDPGELASVLITSESGKTTVDQMIKEFGIEKLDDYINRAREFRKGQTTSEEGWRDLFDGKTLNGWKVLNQDWTNPGSKPDFLVENGMIVCNTVMGNEGGYLITEKSYSDFILELDVKLDTSLNSGIQCRGRLWDKDTSSVYLAGDPNGTKHDSKWRAGEAWGYQIEVDPSPRAWSGGLYEPCNRGWLVTLKGNEPARKAFKPADWNHFKIVMKGNRIQTWVNNVPIVDTTDDLTSSGFIGLQFHGAYNAWQKDKKSLWKNIRINEL
jgi:hypothetical protein